MSRSLLVAVLVLAAGCFRSTRQQHLDQPVDTGVLQRFGDERGPALEWDCGDGSPAVTAPLLSHAFARAGHYVVQGHDGAFLAWRFELEVVPRALPRAVPADAEALLYVPTLADDLSPTVDFLERLVDASTAERFFEQTLLPAMAIDGAASGSQDLDPQEGVGIFLLPGFQGQVALLGITDEGRALAELNKRLGERGRVTTRDGGLQVAETLDGISALGFADRGYLYVVVPDPGVDPLPVVTRVRTAASRGLDDQPTFASHPLGGNLGLYAATAPMADQPPGPFQALRVGVTVHGLEARLHGEVQSPGPLWSPSSQATSTLLDAAAEGPVAAVALTLPAKMLVGLVLGAPGSPARARFVRQLAAIGVDFERLVEALSGQLAALAYFDQEAFLRNLIAGTQRPEPRGTLLLEAGLTDTAVVEGALKRVLEVMGPPRPEYQRQGQSSRWATHALGQEVRLSVQPGALRVEAGSPIAARQSSLAWAKALSERFDGAFGPGHSSLLLDVGQLRDELMTPRLISGLDPTQVISVQAFASAFLDKLTPVDHVLLDLVPSNTGASLEGRVVLKARDK